jgi:hypothetical protein
MTTTRTIALLLSAAALAACGKSGTTAGGEAKAQGVISPLAHAAPFNPADALSIESVNACYMDAADVSAAMGDAFKAGAPVEIAAEMRTCIYDSSNGQIRVNVTWVDPVKVDEWRKKPMVGEVTFVDGDPDMAAFEKRTDGDTCAVSFMRANLQYDMRLMECSDTPDAQTKLMKLPRP